MQGGYVASIQLTIQFQTDDAIPLDDNYTKWSLIKEYLAIDSA
jgi:hypothetical protein